MKTSAQTRVYRHLILACLVLLCASTAINFWALHMVDKAFAQTQQAIQVSEQAQEHLKQLLQKYSYYKEDNDYTETDKTIPTTEKTLTVTVTAYCSCEKCCGIWSKQHPSRINTDYEQYTSSGTIPAEGRTIAVDPKIIPMGSKVLLDGVMYTAEDTGGAIKGNHIDVYFENHKAALQYGKQIKEVTIYES